MERYQRVWREIGSPFLEGTTAQSQRTEAVRRFEHGSNPGGFERRFVSAVQTIGGWSSLRMVERYAHVDDAELARAVRVTHSHTDEATRAVTATEDEKKIRLEGRSKALSGI